MISARVLSGFWENGVLLIFILGFFTWFFRDFPFCWEFGTFSIWFWYAYAVICHSMRYSVLSVVLGLVYLCTCLLVYLSPSTAHILRSLG